MEYITLPNTDILVSRVAFGGWTIAGGERWGDVDDAESVRAVRAAVDGGMCFIDTAEGYGDGKSEELIGKGLEGIRDRAVIASKVHYNGGHFRYDSLIRACEDSLKRLRTDYVDLYQLHWPVFTDESREKVVLALEKLLRDGKIRRFGVCNFGVEQLEEFLPHARPVTNQLPYSVIWRSIENGIIERSLDAGMGILAYSALHSGILSGRFRTADEIPESRVAKNVFANKTRRRLTMGAIETLSEIAGRYGVTMPALALGWVLRRKGVTSILVGARSVAQVERNLALDVTGVPEEAWQDITAATEALKAEIGDHADMFQDPSRIR